MYCVLQFDSFFPFSFEVGDVNKLLCRVIADQLEGNEEEHNKYRLMVVKYMKVYNYPEL